MKLFSNIYKKVIELAEDRSVEYYLGSESSVESSFFLMQLSVVLMPMSLTRSECWV